MLIRRLIICLLLLCQPLALAAQTSVLDSLNQLYTQTTADTSRALLLADIARLYLAANPDTAIAIAQQGLALARKVQYKRGEARCLNNIGAVYYTQNSYPQALEFLLQALKIREEIGDKPGMANTLNNIGLIYYEQKNYKLSLRYHERSLAIKQETGDKRGISYSLNNIGLVYYEQKQLAEALANHLKALAIRQEISDLPGTGASLTNIGIIYDEQADYQKALTYHLQAEKIYQQLEDKATLAAVYNNIASVYLKTRRFNEGIGYAQKAFTAATEAESVLRLKEASATLAAFYSETGDYKKAFEFHRLFMTYHDSLLNEENTKKINQLETGYELEKKKKELELREQENKNQRLVIYGLALVSTLIVALAIVLWRNILQKEHSRKLLMQKNEEIEQQKHAIEKINHNMTASITYARRIQSAILPSHERMGQTLGSTHFFALYQPRDIVSGDFYWFSDRGDAIILAVADCTGHGVPGAFMSMIGNELLNHIVTDGGQTSPDIILAELHKGLHFALTQDNQTEVADGMDIAVVVLHKNPNSSVLFKQLQFSGAMNNAWIFRNKVLHELKADKLTIGGKNTSAQRQFSVQSFDLQEEDMLYLFTDGYADQFGGPQRRKFMSKRLKELLTDICTLPPQEQHRILHREINDWMERGNEKQTDDITAVGLRF